MSSSTQSPLEPAEAQTPQLDSKFEVERTKFRNDLEELLGDKLKYIIYNFENPLIRSETARIEIAHKLQVEEQLVDDLIDELDGLEAKQNSTSIVKHAEERISRLMTRTALRKSQGELQEAMYRVAALEEDSRAAKQQINDLGRQVEQLSTTLSDVNKQKDRLRDELERSKRESADVQKRLKAAEQRNKNLESVLQVAAQRASTAEKKLKVLDSIFKHVNDGTSTSASSSGQQPDLARKLSSPPAPLKQGSVEQSESGQQINDFPALPQSLNPQVGNKMSEEDLSLCKRVLYQVMDTKNWVSNRYFLKTMDSLTLASRDAKVGPLNLNVMEEKLVDGAYNSVISFQRDFDRMIADARTLNSPQNLVRIAAEELRHIFYQAHSSQQVSGHETQETAQSAQGLNAKKRKADTESLVSSEDDDTPKRRSTRRSKRRSRSSVDQGTTQVQIVNPGTGGSLEPASPCQDQSVDSPNEPGQIDACPVVRKITAGKRLDIEATLSCVAQLVSFEKSPNTLTGDWKSLVPHEYWITKHTIPSDVEKCISYLVRPKKNEVEKDVFVLRLTPATESDRSDFDRILGYLIDKKRCAAVSTTGIDKVESINLIPASEASGYPEFLSTLNFDLLPRAKTENVLLMSVVFYVAKDKQGQVRAAWSERMAAIQNRDKDGLPAMRKILERNPLHIFQSSRMLLTSAERYLARLNELPIVDKVVAPALRAYGQQAILRLSYNAWYQRSRYKVDGVIVPKWVFVLGRVNDVGNSKGLLVVDVQMTDRPIWLLRRYLEKSPLRRTITLLADKFPGSLEKWQSDIPQWLHNIPGEKCLEDTGVTLKRCRFRA